MMIVAATTAQRWKEGWLVNLRDFSSLRLDHLSCFYCCCLHTLALAAAAAAAAAWLGWVG